MDDLLFDSFFMGGFECSTHRLKSGRRLDVIAATRHDELAERDYERMVAAGLRTARDGLRWHLIDRGGRHDFSSLVGMLRAARRTGLRVIWDLFHYGWPDDLDVFSPELVDRFASFARASAAIIAEESREAPWICPVNEISFFSWAGAEAAVFNPAVTGRGEELKRQLVRCAIVASREILAIAPGARLVHTDPVINVVHDPARPEDAEAAERHRQSQFHAFDMIAGQRAPELGGAPELLDVLGLNYYVHNQWVYPGGLGSMLEPSDPRYTPVWRLFREVWERYRRPMFLAETGIEDEARPAWLRYIVHEVREGRRRGAPIGAVCLYPIVDHPGWEDDRHCHNGLWGYPSPAGARPLYAPLARELELLLQSPERADAETDAHALDSAAHWMEITSTRGFTRNRPPKPK